jgi:hypothetical protein
VGQAALAVLLLAVVGVAVHLTGQTLVLVVLVVRVVFVFIHGDDNDKQIRKSRKRRGY